MTKTATERLNPDVARVVTRRTFLEAGLGVGGALLVGFHVPSADAAAATGGKAVFAPNAFIRIDGNGKITLIMPQVEMGQGIYTAIAMILAEELDTAFEQVVVEAAPPNDKLYANPTFGLQVTGNSNSVRAFWMPLRKAAAGARAMLVQAAAQVSVAKTQGDAPKGLSQGELHEAVYEMPFLAHATMEPLNCTVHVTPTSCEVWVGIQVLSRAQAVAAKVTGLPLYKVTVHNQLIGGGFGRRLETDFIEKALRVAKQVDGPVKVVYTRAEDIQHDVYRPVYLDRLSASLSNGRIVGWKHRITGSAVIARWLPPAFQKGIDIDAIDSAADLPYDIPNLRVEYVRDEPPAVPTGFWRGAAAALGNALFAATGIRLRRLPIDRDVLSGKKPA